MLALLLTMLAAFADEPAPTTTEAPPEAPAEAPAAAPAAEETPAPPPAAAAPPPLTSQATLDALAPSTVDPQSVRPAMTEEERARYAQLILDLEKSVSRAKAAEADARARTKTLGHESKALKLVYKARSLDLSAAKKEAKVAKIGGKSEAVITAEANVDRAKVAADRARTDLKIKSAEISYAKALSSQGKALVALETAKLEEAKARAATPALSDDDLAKYAKSRAKAEAGEAKARQTSAQQKVKLERASQD